mmetsp:Transcript_2517/g.16633  ORF Transcript_2517/g.16633 Transcript_2517/m.16633 type:complete len:105 (+) Transcript_2517:60-374(+)
MPGGEERDAFSLRKKSKGTGRCVEGGKRTGKVVWKARPLQKETAPHTVDEPTDLRSSPRQAFSPDGDAEESDIGLDERKAARQVKSTAKQAGQWGSYTYERYLV